MKTITTKLLIIITLASAASLSLAASAQAKPDNTHINHARTPSGQHMTKSWLKQMNVHEATMTTNVTPILALAVVKSNVSAPILR